MSNYKEDKAKAWQRSSQVTVKNGYNEVPSIEFAEEFITEFDGSVLNKTSIGSVATSLKNPMTSFPLLNPQTDEVIGEGKYLDAYVILYSIYRYLADKRDLRLIKRDVLLLTEATLKDALGKLEATSKLFDKAQAEVVKADAIKNQELPINVALIEALNKAESDKESAKLIFDNAKLANDAAKLAFNIASDYLA